MIETVKNISSDYLIVFMDDFFIRDNVDTRTIFSIFEYMELHPGIACMSEYGMKDRFLVPTPLEHFLDYGDVCKLKVNLAAVNFWRTKDYLDSWKEHETPWEYEAFGTIRSFHNNKKYYTIDEVWNSPILIYETPEDSWLSCVFKGKWILPRVEKLFSDHAIKIDFSIRGVYLEDHFVPPATGLDQFHIKKVYRSFMSIGFIWTMRKIQYCIVNKFFNKHPVQYIEYIRLKKW